MKVVLDTNVLVSAFYFPGGPPEAVFRLFLDGQLELFTSRELLLEFATVVTEKFGWERDRAEDAIRVIAAVGKVVRPTEVVFAVEADPSDNRVLEAGLGGRADVVVSGDRHLLRLGDWRGMQIMAPADFMATLD